MRENKLSAQCREQKIELAKAKKTNKSQQAFVDQLNEEVASEQKKFKDLNENLKKEKIRSNARLKAKQKQHGEEMSNLELISTKQHKSMELEVQSANKRVKDMDIELKRLRCAQKSLSDETKFKDEQRATIGKSNAVEIIRLKKAAEESAKMQQQLAHQMERMKVELKSATQTVQEKDGALNKIEATVNQLNAALISEKKNLNKEMSRNKVLLKDIKKKHVEELVKAEQMSKKYEVKLRELRAAEKTKASQQQQVQKESELKFVQQIEQLKGELKDAVKKSKAQEGALKKKYFLENVRKDAEIARLKKDNNLTEDREQTQLKEEIERLRVQLDEATQIIAQLKARTGVKELLTRNKKMLVKQAINN